MAQSTELEARLAKALRHTGAEIGPSECHGLVAGLICSRGRLTLEEWLSQVAEGIEEGDVLAREAQGVLGELLEETTRELSDTLLRFDLLLPEEAVPLEQRTEELGNWCQGFLMGLSGGGLKNSGELPADTAEAIRDLTEIARAGQYGLDEGDDEENEGAYAELTEYVRTAVLLINEELNPTKAPPITEKTTVH